MASAKLDAQQQKLNLHMLPTTTTGSFPQTMDLTRVLLEYKAKKISKEDYVRAIKAVIEKVFRLQEELDIDVLVQGEPQAKVIAFSHGDKCLRHGLIDEKFHCFYLSQKCNYLCQRIERVESVELYSAL